MAVLKNDASTTEVKPGITRKMIYGSDLMMVVIDFTNGPWAHPDPPHSHVHEQTSYIAGGKIRFICEGESDQILSTGDMFYVPSGRQHTIQLLSESARLVDSFNPVRKDFI
ncbi:MAG TPA: cupin domain-containing protein [Ohtaekwangia sp.]|nr:cupin domain-containing protein [Ohtaekwangia sp.]